MAKISFTLRLKTYHLKDKFLLDIQKHFYQIYFYQHIFFVDDFFLFPTLFRKYLIMIIKHHHLSTSKIGISGREFFRINNSYEEKNNSFFMFTKCCLLRNMYHKETVLYHLEIYQRSVSYITLATYIVLVTISHFSFGVPYTSLKVQYKFYKRVLIFTFASYPISVAMPLLMRSYFPDTLRTPVSLHQLVRYS